MTTLENAVLTIEEAAKILGISKKLCYTAAERGEIPAKHIGARWIVLRKPLEEMLGLGDQQSA